MLDLIDRIIRPPYAEWRPDDIKFRMRRWDGERWVYREMDAEEYDGAYTWWAIR